MNNRIPAEWEPHNSVWLAWPYDLTSFGSLNEPEKKMNPARLPAVEKVFLQIVQALSASEQVNLIVRDRKAFPHNLANVSLFEANYADIWTRDYLPIFTGTAALKFTYNAYGSQFPGLLKDNDVWKELNKNVSLETIETGIILEPGAIEMNGAGVLLTTEQCLLKRNPHMSKADYEKIFAKYLGITQTIWLKDGLPNDHTDGHVDETVRFVSPSKVLCVLEQDNAILKKTFETVVLLLPNMKYNDGKQAPASYANFYIGNSVVLVPTFRDPHDEIALKIIQQCFPDRSVVGIDCVDIIYGGGTLHCMSQQQPQP